MPRVILWESFTPQPLSFRKLKEAVCLPVHTFTSCAVVWDVTLPSVLRRLAGAVWLNKRAGGTQELRKKLLTLLNTALPPTTAGRSAEVLTQQVPAGLHLYCFGHPARWWRFLQKSLKEKENEFQLLDGTYSHMLNFKGQSPLGSVHPTSPCLHKSLWLHVQTCKKAWLCMFHSKPL